MFSPTPFVPLPLSATPSAVAHGLTAGMSSSVAVTVASVGASAAFPEVPSAPSILVTRARVARHAIDTALALEVSVQP